jgi:hypothetical protein
MLLPREQNPWNCGYYLGAFALRALRETPNRPYDVQELGLKMSDLLQRTLSPTQVVTAASWLYLLGLIELDQNGAIRYANQ